ncbi:MAG: hypothetical protein HY900_06520 [Deltaproteobacteria bacterium]|nr:hypothetical protein [Deltaproteobacteria bacterium]
MNMVRKLSLAAAVAGLIALPGWSVAGEEEMDFDEAEVEVDNSGEGNAEDDAAMMDEDADVDNEGEGNAEDDAAMMDEDVDVDNEGEGKAEDEAAMAAEADDDDDDENFLERAGENIGDAFRRVF